MSQASEQQVRQSRMRRNTVLEVIITSALAAGGIILLFGLLWVFLPGVLNAVPGIVVGLAVLIVAIGGLFLLFQSDVALKQREEDEAGESYRGYT
jgi:protein-S-isoprenylcysteine O-methyltransferase Ste14